MWHFEIKLRNARTDERQTIQADIVTIDNYFDAWKACADIAKRTMDAQESPFDWYIVSISDTTRR